jgi:predicted acylesterase/phospholipase RssA
VRGLVDLARETLGEHPAEPSRLQTALREALGLPAHPEKLRDPENRKRLGLALSGGGLLGSFQAGVLRYLTTEENWKHYAPAAIAGTSVGSVNGVALSHFKRETHTRLSEIWDGIKAQRHFLVADPEPARMIDNVNTLRPFRPFRLSEIFHPDRRPGSRPNRVLLPLLATVLGHLPSVTKITAIFAHLPIQQQLFEHIGPDYKIGEPQGDRGAESALGSIPFIATAASLDDSHIWLFSNDDHVYKYSYWEDFAELLDVRRVSRFRLARSVLEVAGLQAEQLPSSADRIERIRRKLKPTASVSGSEAAPRDRLVPGVIASANIPLALGTIDIELAADSGEHAEWHHFADGALRLNHPINVLIHHFTRQHRLPRSVSNGSTESGAETAGPITDFDTVIAVSCTSRVLETADFSKDRVAGVQIYENLGRAIEVVLNQISVNTQTSVENAEGKRNFVFINPASAVHSAYVVDPGLIQISMDYGYMRAYDMLEVFPRLAERPLEELLVLLPLALSLSMEIALHRKAAWAAESHAIFALRSCARRFWRRQARRLAAGKKLKEARIRSRFDGTLDRETKLERGKRIYTIRLRERLQKAAEHKRRVTELFELRSSLLGHGRPGHIDDEDDAVMTAARASSRRWEEHVHEEQLVVDILAAAGISRPEIVSAAG